MTAWLSVVPLPQRGSTTTQAIPSLPVGTQGVGTVADDQSQVDEKLGELLVGLSPVALEW